MGRYGHHNLLLKDLFSFLDIISGNDIKDKKNNWTDNNVFLNNDTGFQNQTYKSANIYCGHNLKITS